MTRGRGARAPPQTPSPLRVKRVQALDKESLRVRAPAARACAARQPTHPNGRGCWAVAGCGPGPRRAPCPHIDEGGRGLGPSGSVGGGARAPSPGGGTSSGPRRGEPPDSSLRLCLVVVVAQPAAAGRGESPLGPLRGQGKEEGGKEGGEGREGRGGERGVGSGGCAGVRVRAGAGAGAGGVRRPGAGGRERGGGARGRGGRAGGRGRWRADGRERA